MHLMESIGKVNMLNHGSWAQESTSNYIFIHQIIKKELSSSEISCVVRITQAGQAYGWKESHVRNSKRISRSSVC